MKELLNWITGVLMGVALGVSYMKAYPPKKDQELSYNIACLDGQIAVFDTMQGKAFKTCSAMWEEQEHNAD